MFDSLAIPLFARSIAIIFFAIGLLCGDAASGQSKLEVGEEVEVKHLGKWKDGTVLEKGKKNQYLVSFVFINEEQQVFDRSKIRKLCEVDALDFCRSWESARGTFRIEAAPKKFMAESVLLIKPDLSEIEVPLKKLSTKDNAYARRFKKKNEQAVARGQAPIPTPELPELEVFSNSFGGKGMFGDNSGGLKTMGSLPDCLTTFGQAGVGFNLLRPQQKLISVLPVGGPEQLVLIATRDDEYQKKGFQSQLYWVSLKQQRVIGYVPITAGHYALDYDPENKLLLTFFRKGTARFDEPTPDYYTVWKLESAASEAEPLVRWSVEDVSWTQDLFAKIVSDRVVVGQPEKNKFEAWDFVSKETLYSVKQESFFGAPVVLSPDRKKLIIPQDKDVTIIDAATGNVDLNVKLSGGSSGANLNSDGTKLAAINSRGINVWDLTGDDPTPKFYSAPLVGSPFRSRLDWISDDQVLGENHGGRVLYSLSLQLPVWTYVMDTSERWMNANPLVSMVVNQMVFYVSRPSSREPFVAIGAVNLPGPSVMETISSIDKEALYALHPGVRVSLDTSGTTDSAKATQWLEKKIEDNGWVLDDNAEFKMIATMGTSEARSETYLGVGGRKTKVNFTPHFANLKITRGKVVVWQSGTSTGAPGMINGEPNSFQSQVSKMQKPPLKFFERVSIADKIIDAKYSKGFGKSKLGKTGIHVISRTPPKREDNPSETADQDERERLDALGGQQGSPTKEVPRGFDRR